MGFNGSGTFSRIHSWITDKANGVKITASRMDAEDDNFANGLSNCMTRDGQSPATNNIPFGGFRLTNVGNATAATDALNRQTADARYTRAAAPSGRLTLSAGVPVMTSTVSGATTIRYTPYVSNILPTYDGSSFSGASFSELSLTPTMANNTNYDVFGYLSAGVPALAVAAWNTDTTRAISLTHVDGLWLNASDVSAGPASLRGTFLGTVRTNGSAQLDWILGGAASGGTAARLCVWNAYNRIRTTALVQDSGDSWQTANQWESLHSSTNNRVSLVIGLSEDSVSARLCGSMDANLGLGQYAAGLGIGLDSTSLPSGVAASGTGGFSTTYKTTGTAFYEGYPGIGFHYLQALQAGNAAGSGGAYFFGTDSGNIPYDQGLYVTVLA